MIWATICRRRFQFHGWIFYEYLIYQHLHIKGGLHGRSNTKLFRSNYQTLTRRPNSTLMLPRIEGTIQEWPTYFIWELYAQALAHIPDLHVIKWRIFVCFIYQVQFRWFAALHWTQWDWILTRLSYSLSHDSYVGEESVPKVWWMLCLM